MEDDIDVAGNFTAEMRIAHITVDNLDLIESVDGFEPAPVVEGIVAGQRPDFGAGFQQCFGQVRTDKTICTGHQNF